MAPPSAPPKSGVAPWVIALIAGLLVVVFCIGVLAVIGVFGVRKYLVAAKTSEARNSLAMLARDAIAAYERDGTLCPSATRPVPASRALLSGKKYQSLPGEWDADASQKAGFACLGFSVRDPQYFQYEYEQKGDAFTARAHGDLNGDGVFSTLELTGRVVSGHVVIAPALKEENSEE